MRETIVKTFTNVFRVQGEEVKAEGKFLELDEDASNEMEKFTTLRQVEEKIDIKLLKYDKGYGEESGMASILLGRISLRESRAMKSLVYM